MHTLNKNEFLSDLRALCAIDSGKDSPAGKNAVADFYESRYRELGLSVERRYYKENPEMPFLLIRNSQEPDIDVLFAAHMDTVFSAGTAEQWPLQVDENGIAHGPGCVDCKSGGLLTYYLLRDLLSEGKCGFRFAVCLNSDEETGSLFSRAYFEELAAHTDYALIMEPGRANNEFVSTRKGGGNYLIKCHGISAHSGVDPEKGASAILELARWVHEIYKLTDYEGGTTLNVGRFTGGADNGAVPDYAECTLSFRYFRQEAVEQLEALFKRMQTAPFDPRTSMEIICKSVRPPMVPNAAAERLFALLCEAGKELGQQVSFVSTGGGSDGNFIANPGTAVLDGCGPSGGCLHTRNEYLNTDSIAERYDILRRLLEKLFC